MCLSSNASAREFAHSSGCAAASAQLPASAALPTSPRTLVVYEASNIAVKTTYTVVFHVVRTWRADFVFAVSEPLANLTPETVSCAAVDQHDIAVSLQPCAVVDLHHASVTEPNAHPLLTVSEQSFAVSELRAFLLSLFGRFSVLLSTMSKMAKKVCHIAVAIDCISFALPRRSAVEVRELIT